MIAEIEVALAALRAVEWSYSEGHLYEPVCYWCDGCERFHGGHKPDCLHQAAIAGLERLLSQLRESP